MTLTMPIMSMFTSPVALSTVVASAGTITATASQGSNIFTPLFLDGLMPIVMDITGILFRVSIIGGIYCIMRSDSKNGLNRIKMATIAYCMLKFIEVFVQLIDLAVAKVKIPIQ